MLELHFSSRKDLRYFAGGRFVELAAGSLAVLFATLPHRIIGARQSSELLRVEVPVARALGWELGAGFWRKLRAGQVLVDRSSGLFDGELLRRWVADEAAGDSALLRICELEVEARVRRFAWRHRQSAATPSRGSRGQEQAEAIARFLGHSFREDISTADVGRAVSLHPNYAMTLFRRECGMSIWQYLIGLRLAHAQQLLLTSDQTVLAIALDSGFGSLARFYAAFTREYGTSPGEFRKQKT